MMYYFINHMPCRTNSIKENQEEITKEQYEVLVNAIKNFNLIAPNGKYYRLEINGTWKLYDLPIVEEVEGELEVDNGN